MTQFENTPTTPPSSGAPGPAGWLPIWIKAVTKPSEQTFLELMESPDVKIQTALIWASASGFVAGLFAGIGSVLGLLIQTGGESGGMGMILGFICGFPILLSITSPLSLVLSTALFQWIAKLFGGAGSFDKLLYVLAAVAAPLTLVSGAFSILSGIPVVGACVSLFSFIFSLYAIYLNITAVKAVNRFGWGQAIGSVFVPSILFGLICGCVVFLGLMLIGPAIGDVFEGVNQGLQFAP